MFNFAHFYTFSYNMIVDRKSLNKPFILEIDGNKLRVNVPYKSYPYNHDFSYKPSHFINRSGKRESLPSARGVGSYPMYNESLEHIGMFIQPNEIFSFDQAKRFKLSNEEVSIQVKNFNPVDTIRFDSTAEFNHDSPKFISTFISHLRNLSGQFWLGKPRSESEGVSIEGRIRMNGSIDSFGNHSNLIPIIRYNKGVPITYDLWSTSLKNTRDEIDVDFAKSLFLDALYENTKNNNREIVLNIANSLDISINKFFKKINDKDNSEKKFDRKNFVNKHKSHKKVSSTYLPGLIAEFLGHILNRNYKVENPDNYEAIRVFWLENRNIVAHGGNIEIEESVKFKLFDAVADLNNWLDEIELT